MYGKTVKLWFVNYPWDHLNRGLKQNRHHGPPHPMALPLCCLEARRDMFCLGPRKIEVQITMTCLLINIESLIPQYSLTFRSLWGSVPIRVPTSWTKKSVRIW